MSDLQRPDIATVVQLELAGVARATSTTRPSIRALEAAVRDIAEGIHRPLMR